MKKRNLVIANWKMNPAGVQDARKIFNGSRNIVKLFKNVDTVICPPFLFMESFTKVKRPKNMKIGAQNVSDKEKGAFTGEVSVDMLKSIGVEYVIVGHSERREMGETNELINKKIMRVFESGLIPVLCIGEKERDKDATYLEFIKAQIKDCLNLIPKKYLVGMYIAYEPIWAIGKSYKESMNATDIHETVLLIKKIAGDIFGRDIANSFKILYGGSVEAENAKSIIEIGNVDGFLVGHASLVPEHFSKIIQSVK